MLEIEVTGGGSSVGVKAAAQVVDIGNASRGEARRTCRIPQSHVHVITARDGIAIVVHPDTVVDGLTR